MTNEGKGLTVRILKTRAAFLSVGTKIRINELGDYLETLKKQLEIVAKNYEERIEEQAKKIEDERERDELLNLEIFTTLTEAKVLIAQWKRECNQVCPHSSLGYRPPVPEARIPVTLTQKVVSLLGAGHFFHYNYNQQVSIVLPPKAEKAMRRLASIYPAIIRRE